MTMYRIEWLSKARKQFVRIARTEQGTILDAVKELSHWPNCRNVKALVGREGYRLRVGRYRVLFMVQGDVARLILIEEVKKRDERTY